MSKNTWSIAKSRTLYNLEYWSGGYFDINAQGELVVTPIPGQAEINLYQLAQSFTAHGLSLPVLVRFSNILHHRVDSLCHAFAQAMQQENYTAQYTAVYPIKVNQQHHVIAEILNAGQGRVGLEAGSKPELMAVLGLAPLDKGIVVCNGYKDREYIRLAFIGQQMGLRPYLVIEKASELDLIIEEAKAMGITPHLGLRVRLASIGKGKWQNTGGEKAKFGLSASQALAVVARIQAAGLIDSLQLMHFHIGSQVANIRDIQSALREAARYYAELRNLGAPINTVDIGGGLGVDYDGTHSRNICSINYSMQEYANSVVHELSEVCQHHSLPHPNIFTESGRAMTAHHAILITNVIDVEYSLGETPPQPAQETDPTIIQDLWQSYNALTRRSALEVYYDVVEWLNKAHTLFTQGILTLQQRAHAEQIYYSTCYQIRQLLTASVKAEREVLDELNEKLADKYFCNFSLFQSVPDAWAIDQLFPIVPLHRLHERPERRAALQDLTCDSDGQFHDYVDGEGVETSLPVHVPKVGEPYLLGIFLVGAYQEILGDMHNLFGDTFSINVNLLPDGSYDLVDVLEGDTVQNMLRYVHLNTDTLRNLYRRRLQAANLTSTERQTYLRELDAGLMGYTYLEQ